VFCIGDNVVKSFSTCHTCMCCSLTSMHSFIVIRLEQLCTDLEKK